MTPHPFAVAAMIELAILFLVIGVIAAVLGFTGVAGAAFTVVRIIAFVFLALFLIALLLGFGVLTAAC